MTTRDIQDTPTLRLREPVDVLAAIPYLVGYHPERSVVVLAMAGTRLLFAAREDLPRPGSDAGGDEPSVLAEQLLAIVWREGADSVVLAGYGADEQVRPVVLGLRDVCEDAGLRVRELLRADGGRYWSYLCDDPACCPPEGCQYDGASSVIAAEWTLAGRVALPDRYAYEGQLDPIQGRGRLAMARATARAGDRLFDTVTQPVDQQALDGQLLDEAHEVLHRALLRTVAGLPLEDDDAAWLSMLATTRAVRDAAWEQIGSAPELAPRLRMLWLDVMRRCEQDLRAAPAALFAYAAWQCGDGHLARVALERALDLEPTLPHARQLRRALAAGLAPYDLTAPPVRPARKRPGRRRCRRAPVRPSGRPGAAAANLG